MMHKLVKRKIGVLTLSLLLFFTQPTPAKAATDASDCKIDRYTTVEQSPVSVGFPVHSDRYVGRTSVNVLVGSFELLDVKFEKNLDIFKDRDIYTSELVSRLSRNKVKINFIYTDKVFPYQKTLKQWEELKAGQHIAYGKQDEANSTWGFVREAINWFDANLDFSQIDTVVLQGPFDSKVASEEKTAVYEAFMTRSEARGFFRPFTTNEKNILNAFAMSGTFDWLSYAHELLHNFGLTDLYDSTGKEQGPLAYKWSLFSSGNPTLFYWERWQLGWIEDSEVLCIDLRNNKNLEPISVNLDYLDQKTYKMVVLRLDKTTAYVAELREPILREQYKNSNRWNDISGQALVTYSVKSDRWPGPIRLLSQPTQTMQDDFLIGYPRELDNYEVEVLDAQLGSTTIGLWSKEIAKTSKVTELRNAALNIRESRLAELKIKADAEAKLAADKAKAEAEAKLAADKAKADAEARAAESQKPVAPLKVAAKKSTIICVKRNSTKKVTAVKPTCPKGYKKKL